MKGLIRTFVPSKKYGFIKGEDSKDYFFHENAFQTARDKANLCDDALVEFDPVPTPKGYRAEQCSLLDAAETMTYVIPDEFVTSRTESIKGWEVLEMGNWIVCGTSRVSPDAARNIMISNALRLKANALVSVQYSTSTGSEASENGAGKGTHYFTIHHFYGRVATVARKSAIGTLHASDLQGLNQRAEAEKRRLAAMTAKSEKIQLAVWAAVLGFCAFEWFIMQNRIERWYFFGGALFFGILVGRSTDYDSWLLQMSPG